MCEISTQEINQSKIVSLLFGTQRPGIIALVDHMEENGFFTAPCSGSHHLASEGGLAQHSLNVYEFMHDLNEAFCAGYEKNTIIIVSLLHDLGKMGDHGKPNYVQNFVRSKTKNKETGEYDLVPSEAKPYVTNPNLMHEEHEIRSALIAERFISLSEEEESAIIHHNGSWCKLDSSFSSVWDKSPLTMLLHFADLWCSRVVEGGKDE